MGSWRGGGGREGAPRGDVTQGPRRRGPCAACGQVRLGPEDIPDRRKRKHQNKTRWLPHVSVQRTRGWSPEPGDCLEFCEAASARPPTWRPARAASPQPPPCSTHPPWGPKRRSRHGEGPAPRVLPEYARLLLSSKQSVAAATTPGCLLASHQTRKGRDSQKHRELPGNKNSSQTKIKKGACEGGKHPPPPTSPLPPPRGQSVPAQAGVHWPPGRRCRAPIGRARCQSGAGRRARRCGRGVVADPVSPEAA